MNEHKEARSVEDTIARSAMTLALEALTATMATHGFREHIEEAQDKAIKALEEALASEQEQRNVSEQLGEPVAFDVWLQECENMTMAVRHGVKFLLMPEESAVRIGTAIQNTTPQQRKPLTEEERFQLRCQWNPEIHGAMHDYIIQQAEAAHNIKE
jgi:hypothetical protein